VSQDILIAVSHGPYGDFRAAEALRLINGAMSNGFRPIVVLTDDGVYLAKANQDPAGKAWLSLSETLEEVVARGLYERKNDPAEFHVHTASLAGRGLTLDDLVEDLEPIDDQGLARLVADNRLQMWL